MKTTTFLIPLELKNRLTSKLSSSKAYGLRKKSLWIREALIRVYEEDKQLASIGLGAKLDKDFVLDKLHLDSPAEKALREISLKIRRQQPLKEGIKGEIIRSAIRYRLKND